ncbi:hypothetical protein BESB_064660 [Besnoitia besnoiti]|uniref:Transmembrane protein n=1 Tax=Besnoitia besnoiti TaxID=94643 RepID=A0A2A9M8X9_BESBE|nr:hypothetical protein BESB_064660 [Besnoitia besnoiti]PFH34435.1 hypothetical protein BESB_064660 [Besnoitia besnoiti]
MVSVWYGPVLFLAVAVRIGDGHFAECFRAANQQERRLLGPVTFSEEALAPAHREEGRLQQHLSFAEGLGDEHVKEEEGSRPRLTNRLIQSFRRAQPPGTRSASSSSGRSSLRQGRRGAASWTRRFSESTGEEGDLLSPAVDPNNPVIVAAALALKQKIVMGAANMTSWVEAVVKLRDRTERKSAAAAAESDLHPAERNEISREAAYTANFIAWARQAVLNMISDLNVDIWKASDMVERRRVDPDLCGNLAESIEFARRAIRTVQVQLNLPNA